MKSIAAAVFFALTATAWADEPKDQEQAATAEPIVLSEAQLDGVTAGFEGWDPSRFVFGIERTVSDADALPQDRIIFNYNHFRNTMYDIQ